jgi:hypothetical protein
MNVQDVLINGAAGAATAFIGTLLISVIRAPGLLHKELNRENETLQDELLAMQDRECPAIVIKKVWVDERVFDSVPRSSFWSLNVLFANDAKGVSADCDAKSVVATLQFYDDSGELLCEVDAGRWGDADQPFDPRISRVPLRRVDFPIGETRELHLAVKFSSDRFCYGIDNDYVATGGRKQSLRIIGENVTAKVRLRAVGVNSEWIIKFENTALGGLRLLSTEPATQSVG